MLFVEFSMGGWPCLGLLQQRSFLIRKLAIPQSTRVSLPRLSRRCLRLQQRSSFRVWVDFIFEKAWQYIGVISLLEGETPRSRSVNALSGVLRTRSALLTRLRELHDTELNLTTVVSEFLYR